MSDMVRSSVFSRPTLRASFRAPMKAHATTMNAAPPAIEAAKRFYTLSLLADPPFRLPLGKFAIQAATEHYTKGMEETKQYADWSEPLSM